jgi:hypothetical protein
VYEASDSRASESEVEFVYCVCWRSTFKRRKRDISRAERVITKKEYRSEVDSNKTFKEFALPILGVSVYKNLLICSAYTDYENEDAYETLYYYGFDDNYKPWLALNISWHELVEKLAHKIGIENIKTSANVVGIHKMDECGCGFLIKIANGKKMTCSKTIIAKTISSVKNIFRFLRFPMNNLISGRLNIIFYYIVFILEYLVFYF